MLSKVGWALNSILFGLLCVTLFVRQTLNVRLPKYDGIFLFIIGIAYVLALGMSLSYPFGLYRIDNVAVHKEGTFTPYHDALLLIPLSFLTSYEIQLT